MVTQIHTHSCQIQVLQLLSPAINVLYGAASPFILQDLARVKNHFFLYFAFIVELQGLGLKLGVDFTFAWGNHNHNHNDNDNSHLNFVKGTVLGDKVQQQGVGIRDKGRAIRDKG